MATLKGWESSNLGGLVSFQKGRKVDTSDYDQPGYMRYLGASGLMGKNDGFASTTSAVIAKRSDLLMLWDGERAGLVGHQQSGVVASTVTKLTPNGKVDSAYLYYALTHAFRWIQYQRTGTGVPHVPKDIDRILKILYPISRGHQVKIATILSTIDTAIEKTEALIVKYQQIKAGLMHDLFTRGVLPNGQLQLSCEQAPELYQKTAIGWIPIEWCISKLEDHLLADPKNGYSPREVDDWQGVYVLGLGCLTKEGFRPNQLKNAPAKESLASGSQLTDGDFLISRANTPELVGLCGIFRDLGDKAIYPDLMMRLRLTDTLDKYFLEALLLMPSTRNRLTALAVGTSSSMAKLNSKSVKSFLIPIPTSMHEQLAITDKLTPVTKQISVLKSQNEKLKQQKSGLMQDLLTGRVPVSVKEPEAPHG